MVMSLDLTPLHFTSLRAELNCHAELDATGMLLEGKHDLHLASTRRETLWPDLDAVLLLQTVFAR